MERLGLTLSGDARDVGLRARELFASQGLMCAESIVLAFAEATGMDSPLIPRLATGFCAGLGRWGGQCGALSGAILAVNLGLGRDDADADKQPCFDICRQLAAEIENLHGSVNCRDIIGLDFLKPEDQRAFVERNIKADICLPLVERMARMSFEAVAAGLGSRG